MSLTLSTILFGGSRRTSDRDDRDAKSASDNAGEVRLSSDGSLSTGLGGGMSIDTQGRVGVNMGGGMTFKSDGSFDIGFG
jgi:hypothetical protein